MKIKRNDDGEIQLAYYFSTQGHLKRIDYYKTGVTSLGVSCRSEYYDGNNQIRRNVFYKDSGKIWYASKYKGNLTYHGIVLKYLPFTYYERNC